MPLTPEEEAELNPVNALAFDLVRVKSQKDGTIPPCWLCMSAEAKEEARQAIYDQMQYISPNITGWNEFNVNAVAKNNPQVLGKVNLWKQAEAAMKEQREAGNPHAFFAN